MYNGIYFLCISRIACTGIVLTHFGAWCKYVVYSFVIKFRRLFVYTDVTTCFFFCYCSCRVSSYIDVSNFMKYQKENIKMELHQNSLTSVNFGRTGRFTLRCPTTGFCYLLFPVCICTSYDDSSINHTHLYIMSRFYWR